MYIYQNGKLYIQKDNGGLVGVDYGIGKITEISGTDTVLAKEYDVCTKMEIIARFHIDEENSYVFPREGLKNESVNDIEKPTRKRAGK